MKDFLIIGQGLAGTALSFELSRRGCSVLVMDDGFKSSSSMVAAGMWNPIVFKRLNKSWKADEFVPLLREFYGDMEKALNASFLHYLNIDRFFPDLEAANQFDEKSDLPGFKDYLADTPDGTIPEEVENKFGSGRVKQGGYVDLNIMLSRFREKLLAENALIEEEFEASKLEINEDHVKYGKHIAKKIIFCLGFKNSKIPWFSELPLRTTKGEVLTIKSQLPYSSIMNVGRFLLPVGNNEFRLGATYEWHTEDLNTTVEAKELLLNKASKLLYLPYEVTDQKAGIRPTVKDRRPLVGFHKDLPTLGVFNGLGTKGVMIAPWLATHFADHIINGTSLSEEINISRFNC